MASAIDNSAFEMNLTPNKRKRESSINNLPISNIKNDYNKENSKYPYSSFMEVKSIADIMSATNKKITVDNPYEIVRKPPKKKTKQDFEENCFINPALDLQSTETPVNPYEVKRPLVLPNNTNNCFVNSGLNIRAAENGIINPFEVERHKISESGKNIIPHRKLNNILPSHHCLGLENPCLEDQQQLPSSNRMIAIPFTPTIGCRINFNDIPLESLTPCSMLANKLVFTPVGNESKKIINGTTPRRLINSELSAISEEAVDIGEELDSYQLELENSINEAKSQKKKKGTCGSGKKKNLMDLKLKSNFAFRINQPEEDEQILQEKDEQQIADNDRPTKNIKTDYAEQTTPKLDNKSIDVGPLTDVVFEEVNDETSEDEFEFKNPMPFVRTFRRKSMKKPQSQLNSSESESSIKSGDKQTSVRSSIRKSFRKFLHPQNNKKESKSQEDIAMQQQQLSSNIFSTIRQSLRRKRATTTKPLITSDTEGEETVHDSSILVDSERTIFKQTPNVQNPFDFNLNDQQKVEHNVKPPSIRSSFRNKTKDARRQLLKTVFKKNVEAYKFE